ncbi:MAG: redox-regulated ATPase YchF [Candidatus Zhuqueibacterota bacterium]
MKLGLIGLQNSGKTTIFNALSNSRAEVTAFSSGKAEPNLAVVDVGDERIDKLSELYSPKKTTYATVELVDFAGMTEGAAKNGSFSAELMALIKNMDALALVVRNFTDSLGDDPEPLEDIERVNTELILSDLVLVETRLERIEANYAKNKKTVGLQLEEKILRRILEQLNDNKPIRNLELSEEEEKNIRGFQFLTKKPFLVILNSDETRFGKNEKLIAAIQEQYNTIEFAGNFEMELAQLSPEDAALFMQDMGIRQSARTRLTGFLYSILGYISFFTVGSDEVRAWSIRKGQTAVEAAGVIHTDLTRGFIRAECFSYNDLIKYGSEKAVKEKGLFRLEGKDYIVKDGDALSIRFNV